ncbi:MAG: hypothetical protein AAGH68_00640 [Pseudomonadota bacterium]
MEATDPDIKDLRHSFPDWFGQYLQGWFDAREQVCLDRVQEMFAERIANITELRNACVLWQAANRWHLVTSDREELLAKRMEFGAEVEALEACLLESGAAGRAGHCIDLFTPECLGQQPKLIKNCETMGAIVWVETAISALGAKRYADLLLEADARANALDAADLADCLAAGSCYRRAIQEATIEAFLEFERAPEAQ